MDDPAFLWLQIKENVRLIRPYARVVSCLDYDTTNVSQQHPAGKPYYSYAVVDYDSEGYVRIWYDAEGDWFDDPLQGLRELYLSTCQFSGSELVRQGYPSLQNQLGTIPWTPRAFRQYPRPPYPFDSPELQRPSQFHPNHQRTSGLAPVPRPSPSLSSAPWITTPRSGNMAFDRRFTNLGVGTAPQQQTQTARQGPQNSRLRDSQAYDSSTQAQSRPAGLGISDVRHLSGRTALPDPLHCGESVIQAAGTRPVTQTVTSQQLQGHTQRHHPRSEPQTSDRQTRQFEPQVLGPSQHAQPLSVIIHEPSHSQDQNHRPTASTSSSRHHGENTRHRPAPLTSHPVSTSIMEAPLASHLVPSSIMEAPLDNITPEMIASDLEGARRGFHQISAPLSETGQQAHDEERRFTAVRFDFDTLAQIQRDALEQRNEVVRVQAQNAYQILQELQNTLMSQSGMGTSLAFSQSTDSESPRHGTDVSRATNPSNLHRQTEWPLAGPSSEHDPAAPSNLRDSISTGTLRESSRHTNHHEHSYAQAPPPAAPTPPLNTYIPQALQDRLSSATVVPLPRPADDSESDMREDRAPTPLNPRAPSYASQSGAQHSQQNDGGDRVRVYQPFPSRFQS